LTLAGRSVDALRITYVGELGWELHMATEDAPAVFDALLEAGRAHGLSLAGYRAIESLRLEKGYRAWGADITPNDNPFEAGLGFAVSLQSERRFLGREALEAQRGRPLKKRMASFVCDDTSVTLVGRETILRDGAQVGYLTSGGYGYTIGRPIGMGYVRDAEGVTDAWLGAGRYELVVAGETTPCRMSLEPLYDAKGVRVRM
jgi:4-methylaminobutanoate oxidase (formaldehyde-forming)